jgi:uncharacterized membrane protein
MFIINRLNAAQKLIASFLIAIITFFLTNSSFHGRMLHVLGSWDVFCIFFLLLHWITFFTSGSQQIRAEAKKQDEGRVAVFIIALMATLAALMAAVVLLTSKEKSYHEISLLLCTFGGLILSWTLMHTIFTIRYAHIYYADDKDDNSLHAGGLEFPKEKHPDFLDFAYYSFIIGMTFQVSDVSVSSRHIRRLTLLHSLMSFAFNTIIVALTVNLIAGL